MQTKVNALIIGQGLAGTLLSFELLERGQKVLVLDDGDPRAASRLAAGLMSPISGQRTALIWNAAELLKSAQASYARLEKILSRRLFFPLPLKRYYVDEAQRERFRARKLQDPHKDWLGEEFESGVGGGIEIKATGWLDCGGLVSAWRSHLASRGALASGSFNYQDLEFAETLRYGDIEADQLIFCAGLRAASEGPFKFLRFQPTKGELLTVQAEAGDASSIRYARHFAIPLGGQRFRVGASYDREDLSPEPSAEVRKILEASAEQLLGKTRVLHHDAGIRPNILGHFPVLGSHPEIPQLYILNGFGSKGALWAPYCAASLANWILKKEKISEELNVQRFAGLPRP
jgi:glycine oxidase